MADFDPNEIILERLFFQGENLKWVMRALCRCCVNYYCYCLMQLIDCPTRENNRVHPNDPITYVTLIAMTTPIQIQLTRIGLQPFVVGKFV